MKANESHDKENANDWCDMAIDLPNFPFFQNTRILINIFENAEHIYFFRLFLNNEVNIFLFFLFDKASCYAANVLQQIVSKCNSRLKTKSQNMRIKLNCFLV